MKFYGACIFAVGLVGFGEYVRRATWVQRENLRSWAGDLFAMPSDLHLLLSWIAMVSGVSMIVIAMLREWKGRKVPPT